MVWALLQIYTQKDTCEQAGEMLGRKRRGENVDNETDLVESIGKILANGGTISAMQDAKQQLWRLRMEQHSGTT